MTVDAARNGGVLLEEQPTTSLPVRRGCGRAGWAQASIAWHGRALSAKVRWGWRGIRDALGRCGREARA